MTDVIDRNQKVRELAYSHWEDAGRPESDGVEFWLSAEKAVPHLTAAPGMHLEATIYAGGVGIHEVPDAPAPKSAAPEATPAPKPARTAARKATKK